MTEAPYGSDNDVDPADGRGPDRSWELQEVAPVVLVAVVGLLFVGGAVSGWLAATNDVTYPGDIVWASIILALRWIDPTTVAMLLAAAALVWWQYGRWVPATGQPPDAESLDVHVERLRRISIWLVVVFALTVALSLLFIVASGEQAVVLGNNHQSWAIEVEEMCFGLGSAVLAAFGLFAAWRVAQASRGDGEPGSD